LQRNIFWHTKKVIATGGFMPKNIGAESPTRRYCGGVRPDALNNVLNDVLNGVWGASWGF
jgi:hypothetical protein